MSVKVSTYPQPTSLGTTVREHSAGVRWRITKKNRLVILDIKGAEVASYKDYRWFEVWLTDDGGKP